MTAITQEETGGGDTREQHQSSGRQIMEILNSYAGDDDVIEMIDCITAVNFVKELNIIAASTVFVDPHSLLALTYSSYPDRTAPSFERRAVENELKETLEFTSLDHVIVAESYWTDFPFLFQSEEEGTESCILPAFPTVEAWKQAFKNSVDYDISATKRRLLLRSKQLTGEAYLVASKCINLSYEFLHSLFIGMIIFHGKLMDQGHAEADAWSLVSGMVRRIFRDLDQERGHAKYYEGCAGGEPEREVEAIGGRLRATLKAHQKAKEFQRASFWQHPNLQADFNTFLLDTMVLKSKYETLEKRNMQLEERNKELEMRLKSNCNNNSNKQKGGKGKSNNNNKQNNNKVKGKRKERQQQGGAEE